MLNIIILSIFHLIGDFYLQSTKLAKCKNATVDDNCNACKKCKQTHKFNLKFLLFHTLLYTAPFALLFFKANWLTVIISMAVLFASHFIIDLCTCYLNKKIKKTVVFMLDQGLHIGIIAFLGKYFLYNISIDINAFAVKIVFACLLLIVPSSVFINKLLQDVFNDAPKTDLFDIGSIIGILERILVVIFAYYSNFAAIAIIITVKTWARANDLKETEFRQKYLLGTLASLVLAVIVFLIYKVI